ASCMDETGIEKSGMQPIKAQLEAIERLRSAREMATLVAQLQMPTGGYRSILFRGGSDQDPDDSESVIASLDQGGLALPDRDYYTKEDAKSKETRERYLQHVQRVFELLSDAPAVAKQNAETVLRLETAMAKASLTRVERRDPHKLVHKMKVADLIQLAPNFDWVGYYHEMQYPQIGILNVDAPEFIRELNLLLASEPIDSWKSYLRFHVADTSSPYLSSKFVEESF